MPYAPITETADRAAVAETIVAKFLQSAKNQGEPYAAPVLKDTVVRLLTAFSQMDVDNYKSFRGLDLAGRLAIDFDEKILVKYRNAMPPYEVIKKIATPYADGIDVNGTDTAPEASHILAWLFAIKDTADHSARFVYCNGHWTGIYLEGTRLLETNSPAGQYLAGQTNCSVDSYDPSFTLQFPDPTDSAPNCSSPQ